MGHHSIIIYDISWSLFAKPTQSLQNQVMDYQAMMLFNTQGHGFHLLSTKPGYGLLNHDVMVYKPGNGLAHHDMVYNPGNGLAHHDMVYKPGNGLVSCHVVCRDYHT